MKRFRFLAILLIVAVIAVALRCHNITHGFGIHPDERHIVSTTLKINWENLNPEFFAYGSFPFYLGRLTAGTLSYIDPEFLTYDGMFIVGRWISVIFGVLTVFATGYLGRALFGGTVIPVLGAALLALNVFHLQLSRFFAFDVILTFFCVISLLGIIRIVQGALWSGIIIAVLATGLAIGTKISAISLLLPLVLALTLPGTLTIKRMLKSSALAFGATIAALVVFVVVEPFAVLDYATFVKHNLEQISMTRGDWRPPYTIQYWNTTPFVYPIYQMFKGTFGVPVFLSILAGLLFLLLTSIRGIREKSLRLAPIIVAVWSVGLFLSVAGLQVKFPRYLLPIYPVLTLVAAYGLVELSRLLRGCGVKNRWEYLPTVFVVLAALVYSIAFSKIYSLEHSYHVASRWIYQNVPDGSRILGVHWDDKVPLALPGFDRKSYKYEGREFELPIYERDTEEKLRSMADQISSSDYIAFPTPRIPGSITRLPDEFIFSDTLLKLLYAERLGYRLVQTVKPKISFLGFVWNTDLLDESFYVYDHPKVTIFKNVDRLAAAELVRRVQLAQGEPNLPTRDEILLKDSGTDLYSVSASLPGWFFDLFIWLIIIEVVGILAWPIAASVFRSAPDRGYALSKTLGVLIFGYIAWILPTLGLVSVSHNLPVISAVLLALIGVIFYRKNRDLFRHTKEVVLPHILAVESIFLIGAIFWLYVRAFQPEIFWGEKVMDFGFFNFFHREQSLPPQDPWAAGHRMQYYYFGTYIFSMLSLLSGIRPAVSYNLALLALPLLLISAAYGLFIQFTARRWLAGLAALSLASVSDYEVLRLWYLNTIKSFDLFWASSRVLRSPAITEYPIWSFIFGDLHAHVIALPFVMMLIATIAYVITPIWVPGFRSNDSRIKGVALLGFIWGSLAMMNSWDFITGAVTVGISLAVYLGSVSLSSDWRGFGLNIIKIAGYGAVFSIVGLAVSSMFLGGTASGVKLQWGYVNDEEFNALWQLFMVHGHWYLLTVVAALALLVSHRGYVLRARWFRVCASLLAISTPIAAMVWYLLGDGGAPVTILVFLSGFAVVGISVFWIRLPDGRTAAISAYLLSATFLVGVAELFFLFDRMNTIFKVYNIIWLLLASGSLALFCTLFERFDLSRFRFWNRILKWSVTFVAVLIIAPTVVATFKNVAMMTQFKRIDGPRPTLDGTAYIRQSAPDDYFMYQWLNTKISGTPIILEAYGNSYGKYTRVQMNTGLPIILGWDHHVSQRGLPYTSLQKRKEAIARIYTSTDSIEVERLLFLFGVDLIVVSTVERETYPEAGLKKFEDDPDSYPVLFRRGKAVVYATPYSKFHPNYKKLLKVVREY